MRFLVLISLGLLLLANVFCEQSTQNDVIEKDADSEKDDIDSDDFADQVAQSENDDDDDIADEIADNAIEEEEDQVGMESSDPKPFWRRRRRRRGYYYQRRRRCAHKLSCTKQKIRQYRRYRRVRWRSFLKNLKSCGIRL